MGNLEKTGAFLQLTTEMVGQMCKWFSHYLPLGDDTKEPAEGIKEGVV